MIVNWCGSIKYGWTCPKCGCSYAPWVSQCFSEKCKEKIESVQNNDLIK